MATSENNPRIKPKGFRFNRSQRRLDCIEWRQKLKQWLLNGGLFPLPPPTLQKQDIEQIRTRVGRVYGTKCPDCKGPLDRAWVCYTCAGGM